MDVGVVGRRSGAARGHVGASLVLFPVLGVTDVASAAAPYGSKYVFLFLGGFLIALALEQWNLHRRFALRILVAAGGNPRRLLGGS